MLRVGDIVQIRGQDDGLSYKVVYIIDYKATLELLSLPLTTVVPLYQLIKID